MVAKFAFLVLLMPIIYLVARTTCFAIKNQTNDKAIKPDSLTQITLSIIFGTVCGAFCLLLLGGPEVIRIGYERYGLWLIAPCTIVVAISLQRRHLIQRNSTARPSMTWIEIARFQAVVMLVAFAVLFQFNLEATGGRGHETYRTGSIEPKEKQYRDEIERHSFVNLQMKSDSTAWWNYWPIRYLSQSDVVIQLGEQGTFDPAHGLIKTKQDRSISD